MERCRLGQNCARARHGARSCKHIRSHGAEEFSLETGVSETESSQNSPPISMGKARLRGRHTESFTALVFEPVAKVISILCHGVVSSAGAVDASRHSGHFGSTTRSRGPLSEVMSCERTNAESAYDRSGSTGTI